MTYNKFIKSRTVKSYFKEISYELSALEAVYVVSTNYYKSYQVERETWMDLIDCLPDTESETEEHGDNRLKLVIQKYLASRDKELIDFKKNTPDSMYLLFGSEDNSIVFDDSSFIGMYSQYDDCIKMIKECSLEKSDDRTFDDRYISNFLPWYNRYGIQKQWVNEHNRYMTLYLDAEGVVESLWNNVQNPENKLRDIYSQDFEFPLPFKRGDIVKYRTDRIDPGGVLIFNGYIEKDNSRSNDMNKNRIYSECLKVTESGRIHPIQLVNVLELDICVEKDPRTKSDKLGKALSQYLKNEIDFVEFLRIYDYVQALIDVL